VVSPGLQPGSRTGATWQSISSQHVAMALAQQFEEFAATLTKDLLAQVDQVLEEFTKENLKKLEEKIDSLHKEFHQESAWQGGEMPDQDINEPAPVRRLLKGIGKDLPAELKLFSEKLDEKLTAKFQKVDDKFTELDKKFTDKFNKLDDKFDKLTAQVQLTNKLIGGGVAVATVAAIAVHYFK